MSNKHNETLEQRKKAQKDFLELKKMQSGEIPPEPKPSEVAVMPTGFFGVLKNFWYHYKVHTILVLFVCVALAIGITQCAQRPKYDAKVVLYTQNYFYSVQTLELAEYMEKYFTDIDENGEINVQILDCSHDKSGTYDMTYTNSLSTKLNAVLAGDAAVQLFIVDKNNLEHLNTTFTSVDEFFVEVIPAPDALYSYLKFEDGSMPEELYIGRRVIEGTSLAKEKDVKIYEKSCKQAIEKIKQDVTTDNL